MVVQGLVSQVVLSLVIVSILLEDGYDLLEDGHFLLEVNHAEDFPDCLFVVEEPAVEPEEDDDVHVEDVMVDLELAQQGQLLFHYLLQHVGKLLDALGDAEGDPQVLVLVALNREPVLEQQRAVGVAAVPEVDLAVGLKPVELVSLEDHALVLLGVLWVNELLRLGLLGFLLLAGVLLPLDDPVVLHHCFFVGRVAVGDYGQLAFRLLEGLPSHQILLLDGPQLQHQLPHKQNSKVAPLELVLEEVQQPQGLFFDGFSFLGYEVIGLLDFPVVGVSLDGVVGELSLFDVVVAVVAADGGLVVGYGFVFEFLPELLLDCVVDLGAVVVEELGEGHEGDEAEVFAEGPVGQIDEDGPVVLVVELLLLQDGVGLLALLELPPLLLEGGEVELGGCDHRRVPEGADFLLRPEAGDVALLREVPHHEVPRVALLLPGQQEQAVDHKHPILPSLRFVDEELVLEGRGQLLLPEGLRGGEDELFGHSDQHFSFSDQLVSGHADVGQSVLETELGESNFGVDHKSSAGEKLVVVFLLAAAAHRGSGQVLLAKLSRSHYSRSLHLLPRLLIIKQATKIRVAVGRSAFDNQFIYTVLMLAKLRMPSCPPSRPYPLSLIPPFGTPQLTLSPWFTKIDPPSRSAIISSAFEPKTQWLLPNLLLLARAVTSAVSLALYKKQIGASNS